MPDTTRTRRELLGDVLKGGLSVGAMAALAGCDTPGVDTDLPPDEDTTRIRRSIASLQASDPYDIIETFQEAVVEMQALPASDPRSWDNQVVIHGDTNFNECTHGDWFFLPWHRLYITYFEEICRELTGNDDFALPYWNWARNPTLPDVFGQNYGTVTDTNGNNPLWNPTRRAAVGESVTSSFQRGTQTLQMFPNNWGSSVLESEVLSEPNFFRANGDPNFSGDLEEYHGGLHVWAGGDMSGGASPNDPMFWTHHCFVDCVWWEWNARRGNPNPNDQNWVQALTSGGTAVFETATSLPSSLGRSTDFVDAQQDPVTGAAATSLATLLMPLFTFNYERVGKGTAGSTTGAQATANEGVVATDTPSDELERRLEAGADVELRTVERFPVTEGLRVQPEEPIELAAEVALGDVRPLFEGEEPGQLELRLGGIIPPERIDVAALLFVNSPEALEEPTTEAPGYLRTLQFFGGQGGMETSKLVNVSRPLRRLAETTRLDDDEPVRFQLLALPVDLGGRDFEGSRTFGIRSVDLVFTQSVIDGEVVERER